MYIYMYMGRAKRGFGGCNPILIFKKIGDVIFKKATTTKKEKGKKKERNFYI